MGKQKYEISLWDSELVAPSAIGEDFTPYYKDVKVATIGTNTMTAAYKAIEPNFVTNINGTHTLTFKMPYHYIDNQTGLEEDNPFLKLMVNERRIKINWKNQWYDLVIKKRADTSDKKMMTFTCQDLFINELSKNGFELDFTNKYGTANSIGEAILANTDWQIDETTAPIQQKQLEDVYKVTISNSIYCKNLSSAEDVFETIPAGSTVLIFYSAIQNQDTPLQLFYNPNGYTTNSTDRLVENGNNYELSAITYSFNVGATVLTLWTTASTKIAEITVSDVSTQYRANRLVSTQKYKYLDSIEKIVNIYKTNNDTECYGYTSTTFENNFSTNNILANNENFITTTNWWTEPLAEPTKPNLEYKSTTTDGITTTKSYLSLISTESTINNVIRNDSIKHMTQYIPDGFIKDNNYVIEMKIQEINGQEIDTNVINLAQIGADSGLYYTGSGGAVKFGNILTTSQLAASVDSLICTLQITDNVNLQTINTSKVYLQLNFACNVHIYSINLFPKIILDNGSYLSPATFSGNNNVIKTNYYYIDEDGNILDKSTAPLSKYIPQYTTNFEKLKTLTAKESNRFNLLQTLAESFQAWVKFTIKYDDSGAILIENNKLQKFVGFVENIGEDTGLTFKYGFDLQSMQRIVNSTQITTSLIVKASTNNSATNGICSIQTASLNPNGTTRIYNFDYYINHGLMSADNINSLFYGNDGYNATMKRYTAEMIELLTEYSGLQKQLTIMEQLKIAYEAGISSSAELLAQAEANQENLANGEIQVQEARVQLQSYTSLKENLNIEDIQSQIDILKIRIDVLETNEDELIKDLNLSLSHFLQEGTWMSNDYIDPEKYYLDALDVSYTSSIPQTSYEFSILSLETVAGFENKKLHVGDVCYMVDKEFFGDSYIDGVLTPNKNKVMVSTMSEYLEEPNKTQITVQNYRTQFEDLFQRIAASSQSLQYSQGEYHRAANSVDANGAVTYKALQNCFNENKNLAQQTANQNVVTDGAGITITDATNGANKTRVTANGIITSADGGETWKNAVTGNGINTNELTAGQINAGEISVVSTLSNDNSKVLINSRGISMQKNGVEKFLLGRDRNENGEYDNDDANIKLKINLGDDGGSVQIGDLDNSQVINANDKFIVTTDGNIESTGGTIGGWEITDSELKNERVKISSLNSKPISMLTYTFCGDSDSPTHGYYYIKTDAKDVKQGYYLLRDFLAEATQYYFNNITLQLCYVNSPYLITNNHRLAFSDEIPTDHSYQEYRYGGVSVTTTDDVYTTTYRFNATTVTNTDNFYFAKDESDLVGSPYYLVKMDGYSLNNSDSYGILTNTEYPLVFHAYNVTDNTTGIISNKIFVIELSEEIPLDAEESSIIPVITSTQNYESINVNDKFIAYQDGRIKSTSGTIGGWTIDQYSLTNGDTGLNTSSETTTIEVPSVLYELNVTTTNKRAIYFEASEKDFKTRFYSLYKSTPFTAGTYYFDTGTRKTMDSNKNELTAVAITYKTRPSDIQTEAAVVSSEYLEGTASAAASERIYAGHNKNFCVYDNGVLKASGADISGRITATGGRIASFNINGDKLIGNQVGMSGNNAGDYAFWAGSNNQINAPFRVAQDGTLYASGAHIGSGSSIGNFNIDEHGDLQLLSSEINNRANFRILRGDSTLAYQAYMSANAIAVARGTISEGSYFSANSSVSLEFGVYPCLDLANSNSEYMSLSANRIAIGSGSTEYRSVNGTFNLGLRTLTFINGICVEEV